MESLISYIAWQIHYIVNKNWANSFLLIFSRAIHLHGIIRKLLATTSKLLSVLKHTSFYAWPSPCLHLTRHIVPWGTRRPSNRRVEFHHNKLSPPQCLYNKQYPYWVIISWWFSHFAKDVNGKVLPRNM